MHLNEYAKSTAIYFFFAFAIALLSPVLAPYLKSLGLTDVQLSLLFSLFPFIVIISSPIIGRISDKLGRNALIIVSVAIEIKALLLYVFAESLPLIMLARIMDAVAFITVTMLALAKIEDTVADKTRGKYAGISLSLHHIGKLVGPLLGGLLADQIFIKAPFFTAIAFLLIMLVFIKKNPKKHKPIVKKDFSWFTEIKEFLSYRELKGMAILGFVMHATNPAIMVFLPLLIIENLKLSFSQVGIALLVLNLPHLLQFIFGKWSDIKPNSIVLLGTAVTGLFMLLLWQASSYSILLVILFLMGIGFSIWNVSAWTLMSRIGEKHKMEGEVIGSYISLAKMGGLASFLVSGLIVQKLGIPKLFLINGILILLGITVAYTFVKEKKLK